MQKDTSKVEKSANTTLECNENCPKSAQVDLLQIRLMEMKQKCNQLKSENSELKKTNVIIQARAEQEEEYITNSLLKKIQNLKKEKEALATNCENEEDFLTNTLNRQCTQLRKEKEILEKTIENQKVNQIEKMALKIKKLENQMKMKQMSIDRQKLERTELESALEIEQESLVNRLWKFVDQLETEKRILMHKLDNKILVNPVQFESYATQSDDENVKKVLDSIQLPSQDSNEEFKEPNSENEEAFQSPQIIYKPQDTSSPNYSLKMLKYQLSLLVKKVETLSNDLVNSRCNNEKMMLKYEREICKLQRKYNSERLRNQQLNRQLSESESSIDFDDSNKQLYADQSASFRNNRILPTSSGGNRRGFKETMGLGRSSHFKPIMEPMYDEEYVAPLDKFPKRECKSVLEKSRDLSVVDSAVFTDRSSSDAFLLNPARPSSATPDTVVPMSHEKKPRLPTKDVSCSDVSMADEKSINSD